MPEQGTSDVSKEIVIKSNSDGNALFSIHKLKLRSKQSNLEHWHPKPQAEAEESNPISDTVPHLELKF